MSLREKERERDEMIVSLQDLMKKKESLILEQDITLFKKDTIIKECRGVGKGKRAG